MLLAGYEIHTVTTICQDQWYVSFSFPITLHTNIVSLSNLHVFYCVYACIVNDDDDVELVPLLECVVESS